MSIKTYAKVLADSISPQGVRLTTWEICCHRWILAEHNTHRVLSRNFRSSRAVPVAKLLEEVRTDPAMPVEWRHNQKGMVAGALMTPDEAGLAKRIWMRGAADAADMAERLAIVDLHKQWANRVLEPYLYVYGVVSTTDTANLYHLRRAADAQPEFKLLADKMYEAQDASLPKLLAPDEWHLPYVTEADAENIPLSKEAQATVLMNLSAARCARVSFRPFDGNGDLEHELARAHKLMADGHMSPFEHQATPDIAMAELWLGEYMYETPEQWGNFYGWRQYRKMIPGECVKDR